MGMVVLEKPTKLHTERPKSNFDIFEKDKGSLRHYVDYEHHNPTQRQLALCPTECGLGMSAPSVGS